MFILNQAHLSAVVASGALHLDLLLRSFMPSSVLPALALVLNAFVWGCAWWPFRHLEAHGVVCEPVRVDELTGRQFTFFSDPDGLPLEVYEG